MEVSLTHGRTGDWDDAARLQLVEHLTANADEVQQEILKEILSLNSETEYLKRFNLGGATDRETFESKVPVVSYEDVKPYIQRVADGDRSAILSAHPILEFVTSSGTSGGERKLIPINKEEMTQRYIYLDLVATVVNTCTGDPGNGKGLYFLFVGPIGRTHGGLHVDSVLSSYYKSDHFSLSALAGITSPIEAIKCLDHFQSMYIQLLCGLYRRDDVLRMGTPFASGLLRAIRFLQLHHQDLARDISTGTLTPKITDPSLRASISHLLKPNPNLARFLLSECSTGSWEGIIPRIWPKTKLLSVIVTGTMAQYLPTLDYYSGGLPLVSTIYGSSECCIGINLNPTCRPSEVSYTIIPNLGYFEFIPLDPNDDNGRTVVRLTDVVVGKEYEVVVTNRSGLYRYRLGDVLRVAGFHNASPRFHFVRRQNVLLSLETEKTDEAELQRGVDSASRLLAGHDIRVVEYTSSLDLETIPGHYVIFLELHSNDASRKVDGKLLENCCLAIEEEMNVVYKQNRVERRSIGALEIRVVREGTFEEFMKYFLVKGASVNQYKVPRCIIDIVPILEMLEAGVVSSHFSSGVPTWKRTNELT